WLAARGQVDRRTVDDTLRFKTRQQRLGSLLVERGHIDAEALCRELELLTVKLAARLMFEAGTYRAEEDWTLPADALAIDYEPLALFVAALRRVPDAGQLERLTGGERTWAVNTQATSADLDCDIGGLEKLVFEQCATPRTLEELQTVVPQQPREVACALACLAIHGLVFEHSNPQALARQAAEPAFPPANPRLRELLAQIEPRHRRKVGAPSATGTADPVIDSDQAEDHKQRAYQVLRDGGDPRQAHKLLAKAVEVVADAGALTVLAELEMHNPLWRPRALERLKQAVAIDPRYTGAWLALANYWSLRLEPDKQRRCLEKILLYEPGHREARHTLDLLGATRPC
ncbi:MAG: hypothetical protein MUF10_12485, partial [Thermoanaerobaculaceae bacterium]|nr:hypothetical protein [Thermoanaerobaculaceae bacterium]